MLLHPITIKVIDRCHVSESNLTVIRKVFKKVDKDRFFKAPRDLRKEFLKTVIDRHQRNFDLYVKVMSGSF